MRFRSSIMAGALVAAMLIVPATSAQADTPPPVVTKPSQYVNTINGTGVGGAVVGSINNFPGPTVPFGMVQYSPDTSNHYAGYLYHQDRIRSFSMNHASAGCNVFGDIPIMATTGEVGDRPWDKTEKYSHDDEIGEAGYYAVSLTEAKIRAELTASTRTGLAKFSYPTGTPAQLFVRPGASLAGNSDAKLTVVDSTTLTGYAETGNFCGKGNRYKIYFTMKFDTPFTSHGTWDQSNISHDSNEVTSRRAGGYFTFPDGTDLKVRTSVSYVSIDGAQGNMDADDVGWDLTALRQQSVAKWDDALGKIGVSESAPKDMEMFYTSLYHSLLHPNVFSDADGKYMGFDSVVHSVSEHPGQKVQYANFSDWDTYRSLAPLQGMLFPEQASDMAQTLVNSAVQSGSLPRWAVANGATGQMTGDNVVPLMVNYYQFGAKNFDTETALEYMVKSAKEGGKGLNGYVERPGAAIYNERGYGPQVEEFRGDHRITGASITLEWSVDDFTISCLAKALGKDDIAAEFQERSNYWQNLYNPATQLITPRDADGVFLSGNGGSGFGADGFDEGNAAQYTWFVPQNIGGLIAALGGNDAVDARLDQFTSKTNVGGNEPHLWIGNEPSFQIPWTYNAIGKPWKTQELIDRVMKNHFFPTPDGQPGNDDLGALASWYVWAAMGSYPFTPGTSNLTVNTPIFDHVVVSLPKGKTLDISAPGAASGKRYIHGMTINGVATDKTYIPENIVRDGGSVVYTLGSTPNKDWGTNADSVQPSYSEGSATLLAAAEESMLTMSPGSSKSVGIKVQRLAGTATKFDIAATANDAGITVEGVSGTFDDKGVATVQLPIKVAKGVAEGSYDVVATVTSGGKPVTVPIGVQVAREGSFFSALNAIGTANESNPGVASFDSDGNSYSRQQLAKVGLAPGQAGTVDGLNFTWPTAPVGKPDMIRPEGQVIKFDGSVSRISFVGAAFNGTRGGDVTVTFTDGGTETTRVAFGDWVIPSSSGDPVEGNSLVAKMDDRNANSTDRPAHIFATKPYQAPAGKKIASVTMNAAERLRIFAIASNGVPAIETATTIKVPTDAVTSGDGFQVSVTVAPASGAVADLAGTVELFADGVSLGTKAVAAGAATFDLVAGAAGSYQYTATFTPSGPEFVASTSDAAIVVVNAGPVDSPEVKVSVGSAKIGDKITVSGTGFAASESLTITLQSVPITLGTANADASGAFSSEVTIPAGAEVGRHHIQVDGATLSAATPFEVLAASPGEVPGGKPSPGADPSGAGTAAPTPGGGGGLPITGAMVGPLLGIAALLVLAGGGLAAFRIIGRRRQAAILKD